MPEIVPDTNIISQDTQDASNAISSLDSQRDKINGVAVALKGAQGAQGSFTDSTVKGIEAATRAWDGLKAQMVGVEQQVKAGAITAAEGEKKISSLMSGFKSFASAAGTVFGAVESSIVFALNNSKKVTQDLGKVLGASIPLAAAKMQQSMTNELNRLSSGMVEVEQELMNFNKDVLQAGMSFGTTFEEAQKDIEEFKMRYTESLQTIRATPEQLVSVQKAFKNLVSVEDQVKNIGSLTSSMTGLKGPVTSANAAILVSAATNTDAATTAGWLSKAMTELGASQTEAILNFGRISWATKGSGLGFEKVGESIMGATDMLKMWGGTVSSVTPLYKAFADSLSGTGQKGLTPQLLRSFVRGLEGMAFGTRALLGMQAPGGAAKGALGAGLDIEAALEEGPEGMKKVSESLIQTLKQFGGGEKILTREEARTDPALLNNFVIQRQLLMQTMNIDQATANKTLAMLQNIDKSGLDVGNNTASKLDELLGSGQRTQESTQSIMDKNLSLIKQATINNGDKIVDAIGDLAEDLGLSDFAQNMENILKKAAADPKSGTNIMSYANEIMGMLGQKREERTKRNRIREKVSEEPDENKQALELAKLNAASLKAGERLAARIRNDTHNTKAMSPANVRKQMNNEENARGQITTALAPILPTKENIENVKNIRETHNTTSESFTNQKITKNIDVIADVHLKASAQDGTIKIFLGDMIQKYADAAISKAHPGK
ncbi:MAG: hypothetical protein WC523_00560 [Patescibacteria group bacterium]